MKNKHAKTKAVIFEDQIDALLPVQYCHLGQELGAGMLVAHKSKLRLDFGFTFDGFPPLASNARMFETILERLTRCSGSLPPGESLSIHVRTTNDDVARQAELEGYRADITNPMLLSLAKSSARTEQQLAASHKLLHYELYVVVSYTLNRTFEPDNTLFENALSLTMKGVRRSVRRFKPLSGMRSPSKAVRLGLDQLQQAVLAGREGLQEWHDYLKTVLGLPGVKSMGLEALWRYYRSRLYAPMGAVSPVPHYLACDGTQVKEKGFGLRSFKSAVTAGQVPKAYNSHLLFPDGRHVGVMVAGQPDGYSDVRQQLGLIYDLHAQVSCEIETVMQITSADGNLIKARVHDSVRRDNARQSRQAAMGSVDTQAESRATDAHKGLHALHREAPLRVSICMLVSAHSLDGLKSRMAQLTKLSAGMLTPQRFYPWEVYLQSLVGLSWARLMLTLHNHSHVYLPSELLWPVLCPAVVDKGGFAWVSDDSSQPIYYDPARFEHITITGSSGSGKSSLLLHLLQQALIQGIGGVLVEYPDAMGNSTSRDWIKVLGKDARYVDVTHHAVNVLERGAWNDADAVAKAGWQQFIVQVLLTLVTAEQDGELKRAIIPQIIHAFLTDAAIAARFEAAHSGGVGSVAWDAYPILEDIIPFCTFEALGLTEQDERLQAALSDIRLKLKGWCVGHLAPFINRPSTVSLTDPQLLVLAVPQQGDAADLEVFGLIGFAAAIRRALAAPRSFLCWEECSILLKKSPAMRQMLGESFAYFRHLGCRVIIVTQDVESFAASDIGPQVCQNAGLKLVGRIMPDAIASYETFLRMPTHLLEQAAAFPRADEQDYSLWLLSAKGHYHIVRHYADPLLMGLIASHKNEADARSKLFAAAPDTERAAVLFARLLQQSRRSGQDILQLVERFCATAL